MVQHVSHKNAEKKKKEFWKGKNAKVSFKKSGFTYVSEIEESSGMKPKFQEKCKFCDIFGHKQADCFKLQEYLLNPLGSGITLCICKSMSLTL